MTSKFYIYRGIPGSGKTTAAMADTQKLGAIRVSRDDIRLNNLGKAWGVDEHVVTKLFYAALRTAFKTNLPVISDATNLQAKYVKQQIELAATHGYEHEFVDFPIDVEVAIARDMGRERQVGEKVIRSFHNRFIGKGGAFPTIIMDKPQVVEFAPYVAPGPGKPHAVLVDIDGTLAHHEGHRGPYEAEKYHLDDFDDTIAEVAWRWIEQHPQMCNMIVMSGRDAAYRNATIQWLDDHDFGGNYQLYMRPAGDRREDSIVKNELFETHIAGLYNVDFVLDDRNRVVDMWRAKGLKCLQVQPGDF